MAPKVMPFPSIHEMDIDVEELERNLPEGMTVSIMPPPRERMRDPLWYDNLIRDQVDQRKIFQQTSSEEIKERLTTLLAEFPRYGPAVYEKAAMQGRLDVVKILHEMGVESDPKTMKVELDNRDDDGDIDVIIANDVPGYADLIEHAFLKAAVHGHLDIVKWFVEEGGVPIDYHEGEDDDDSVTAATYSLLATQGGPHPEITRWLLEHGAPIVTKRDGEGIDDLQIAIKSGSLECVEMIMHHEQAVRVGLKVEIRSLRLSAFSGNVDMVRLVLQSDCFGIQDPDEGLAGQGKIALSQEQLDEIYEGLKNATSIGSVASVKLLLKQLTIIESDGSFKPFILSLHHQLGTINASHDALEAFRDISDIFEVLWDTCLHQYPDPNDHEAIRKTLPSGEALNRVIATASEHGCVNTVKLLVEKYHVDVNHVSHKLFTIPLGRAAGSGKHPVEGRLKVAEYLCSRPDIDMSLAMGEYCNSESSLIHAILQVPHVPQKRRKAELTEMVRLLLSLGGPVDVVDPAVRERCDDAASEEMIDVHVVIVRQDKGRRKVLLTLQASGGTYDIVLRYTPRELRSVLRGIKFRPDDATLKANDPRGRPLIPAPGEEVPEEERAKPTLLTGNDGVISVT